MFLNPGEGEPVETSDLWLVSPLVSKYWALIGGLSQYLDVIGRWTQYSVLILISDWLQVRRLTDPRMLEEGVTISLPDYSEQEIRQGLAVTRDTGR